MLYGKSSLMNGGFGLPKKNVGSIFLCLGLSFHKLAPIFPPQALSMQNVVPISKNVAPIFKIVEPIFLCLGPRFHKLAPIFLPQVLSIQNVGLIFTCLAPMNL